MRLRNVHSLKLEEYQEPRIPPKYAIASHGWSTDEEATIENVRMLENVRRRIATEVELPRRKTQSLCIRRVSAAIIEGLRL